MGHTKLKRQKTLWFEYLASKHTREIADAQNARIELAAFVEQKETCNILPKIYTKRVQPMRISHPRLCRNCVEEVWELGKERDKWNTSILKGSTVDNNKRAVAVPKGIIGVGTITLPVVSYWEP